MSKYHTLRDKKPSQERIYELVRAPIMMWLTSPRSTEPGKTPVNEPIVTSPATKTPGATNASSAICGQTP